MYINFYNFSKRVNSTALPSGTGSEAPTQYDVYLKEDCSIISPVIVLEAGLTARLAYNYAYIPDFGRYYFVDNWTFSGRNWIVSLTLDVLGSYKTEIGASTLYVLRAASSYNGRVQDSFYPMIAKPYTYIDSVGTVYEEVNGTDTAISNYFNTALANGYYYLGIAGKSGTGVSWYVMDANGFSTLIDSLYAFVPSDMTDVSNGIAQQLANPVQYVVSCYWLPSLITGAVLDQTGVVVYFGNYPIMIYNCAQFDPVSNIHKFHTSYTLRKHPQASRGAYLNGSPYSAYTLVFPPFGTFTLDPSLMIDDATVSVEWYIDYSTGNADLLVKVTNSFMVHTSAGFGVNIPLSQLTIDYSGMGGAVGLFAAASTGDYSKYLGDKLGGAINDIVSTVSDVIVQPKLLSSGSAGSFIPFKALSPKLYTDFYEIADEYLADFGRPLCAPVRINTLSGYVATKEGEVALSDTATIEERNMAAGYLTGGFFYE